MTQNPLLMLKCVIQTMLLIFTFKLTEMIELSGSECFAEFHREKVFIFVGEKLKADIRIEDGATVFSVIKTHKSLKNVADEVAYKKVKRQV